MWLEIRRDDARPACFQGRVEGTIELGRIDPSQPHAEKLFTPFSSQGCVRVPIADLEQKEFSRRQLHVVRLPDGRVRVTNKSQTLPVQCTGRPDLGPTQVADLELPVSLRLLQVVVSFAAEEPQQPRHAATADGPAGVDVLSTLVSELPPARADSMVRWWRRVIELLQSAAHTEDFYKKATRALVELIGLDVGAVLVVEHNELRVKDLHNPRDGNANPSRTICQNVWKSRKTVRELPSTVGEGTDATKFNAIDAVVAAPILDPQQRVLGVLYGHRSRSPNQGSPPPTISQLEELLVETLASGVATGLSRLEEQRLKLEEQRLKKVQQAAFEQFFGKELAMELERDPDMLKGRETDVTVLFCDIRGFSAVSEKLPPVKTMEWIYDILSELSEEVVVEGGVLVDYVGDELLAMWGAPTSQPDHASRACRAARRMVLKLQSVSDRWKGEIAAETSVGIGINSARACVGNTGSTRKFKYGPLGSGVNLGSRVQGATKYLKVPAVVTGATRRHLDDSFRVRRLCSVRVVNIVEPVDLFELDSTEDPRRSELFAGYEEALAGFDAGDFRRATRILGNLLEAFPGDGPALVLLSRAVGLLVTEPRDFSPVWQLPGK
ncbi:MAG: adenylate/guanylate cyclase domain-containing protein [Planctomycetia bacterium]|nr:adenylate/guanylate cyclase domain-containing protein [Planctomycetia bacterium]